MLDSRFLRAEANPMSVPELTIGVEEEYQIVDPETRALDSYAQHFLDEGRLILRDQIKP